MRSRTRAIHCANRSYSTGDFDAFHTASSSRFVQSVPLLSVSVCGASSTMYPSSAEHETSPRNPSSRQSLVRVPSDSRRIFPGYSSGIVRKFVRNHREKIRPRYSIDNASVAAASATAAVFVGDGNSGEVGSTATSTGTAITVKFTNRWRLPLPLPRPRRPRELRSSCLREIPVMSALRSADQSSVASAAGISSGDESMMP